MSSKTSINAFDYGIAITAFLIHRISTMRLREPWTVCLMPSLAEFSSWTNDETVIVPKHHAISQINITHSWLFGDFVNVVSKDGSNYRFRLSPNNLSNLQDWLV